MFDWSFLSTYVPGTRNKALPTAGRINLITKKAARLQPLAVTPAGDTLPGARVTPRTIITEWRDYERRIFPDGRFFRLTGPPRRAPEEFYSGREGRHLLAGRLWEHGACLFTDHVNGQFAISFGFN